MYQRLLIAAFILGAMIVSAAPAKADFLGLAPGDYTVTLQNSSTLCGGSNCVGTVHIGSPGATGFDWLFENIGGAANDFDFSHFTHTGFDANTECTIESLGGILSVTNCSGSFIDPTLAFTRTTAAGTRLWFYRDPSIDQSGIWTAIPLAVPEPMSGSLLLFGLFALGLWRRLKAKQD